MRYAGRSQSQNHEDAGRLVDLAVAGGLDIYSSREIATFSPAHALASRTHFGIIGHYDPWGLNLAGIEKQGAPDHKFQYNGIEKQEDLGLNVNMALYRTLDPQLGRWWQVDPEVEGFESLTPYNSNENNPIKNADPEGNCPWCITALKGAVQEYGTQVAINLIQGEDLSTALTDIDGGLILESAVTDGLTLGVSGIAKGARTAARIANALDNAGDLAKASDKASDVAKGVKKVNKNSNDAKGNFVLYETQDKSGNVLKVGKANADDVMKDGTIRRTHTSARKAQKEGYAGAKSVVVENLGTTTTGKAKAAEAARVRNHRANGNSLPLNKEKDKRYHN